MKNIYVWGSVNEDDVASVRDPYDIYDVLSVERCIADLKKWQYDKHRRMVDASVG
jgi:hypothetical protein